MSNKLKDKVAVVTGSGQGIGRAIALALASEGAAIVINNRQPGTPGGDAETTAKQIQDKGGRAIPFFGDISGFETTHRLIQTAVDEFGRLDILVNNAGRANHTSRIWELGEEDWDVCIDSYLKGAFNCTRHATAIMKEQNWGRIINTTSFAWLGAPPDNNYTAAKAGLVGLTWAVAVEMSKYGVTCNAFAPKAATRGTTGNEALKAHARKMYEAGFITEERYIGMKNPPDPATVAPMIAYLCTDEAAYINGQVFDIDGGRISIYSKPVKDRTIFKEQGLWTFEELTRLMPKVLRGME